MFKKKILIWTLIIIAIISTLAFFYSNGFFHSKQCEDYADEYSVLCLSECSEEDQPLVFGQKLKCDNNKICCISQQTVFVIGPNNESEIPLLNLL